MREALTETGAPGLPPQFQGPEAWRASVRVPWLSADASRQSGEGLQLLTGRRCAESSEMTRRVGGRLSGSVCPHAHPQLLRVKTQQQAAKTKAEAAGKRADARPL